MNQNKPKHQRLTPEEQDNIFQRLKENRYDSWKPIPEKSPRYTTGLKKNWWFKPKSER